MKKVVFWKKKKKKLCMWCVE